MALKKNSIMENELKKEFREYIKNTAGVEAWKKWSGSVLEGLVIGFITKKLKRCDD